MNINLLSAFIITFFSLPIRATVFDATIEPKTDVIWLVEDKKENQNLLEQTSPTTSVASYIESRIIAQLKNYDVKLKRVSVKRIDYLLKKNDNACVANRAKLSKRETYSIFSTPQAFYLTHKLFRFSPSTTLPSTLFTRDNEISSIKSVFQHLPTHNLGVTEGVSFGKFLDSEIAKVNQDNIYFRGGINRVVALEAMLYAKRVDFLLALPIDMNPTKQQAPLLEQYTIAGAPPYLIAHFSCSKGELGKKIINDINRTLITMYQNENYYLAHKKWFGEKELLKLQAYLKENYSKKKYLTPH